VSFELSPVYYTRILISGKIRGVLYLYNHVYRRWATHLLNDVGWSNASNVWYRSSLIKQVRNVLKIRNWRWPDASCSLTRWQQFSAWNDVMAAILKVWLQIENRTPSIDAYLLEEHYGQISSRSDRALGFFEEVAPTRTTTRWVAIWNQSLM